MSLRHQPQQQRSQVRLAQILAAAADVFWEMGYDAATTQAIADRAQTAIGTLYRFFPDKLAIFHALEKQHLERLESIHARLLTPHFLQQPLKTVVQQMVQVFSIYFRDPAPRVIYTQFFVAPERFKYFDESYTRALIETFAGLLRSRNPALPIQKSQLISQVCIQAYNALLLDALRSEPSHGQLLHKEIEALLFQYLDPHIGDDIATQSPQALQQATQLQQQHQLSARQTTVMTYALEHGAFTIQDVEMLCPQPSRRSLQRDLKGLIEKGLIRVEGETNQLIYRPSSLATTSDITSIAQP